MAVIVDSSVWIAYLAGGTLPEIEYATTTATLVMSPLVVAEILSGDLTLEGRLTFGELPAGLSDDRHAAGTLDRRR